MHGYQGGLSLTTLTAPTVEPVSLTEVQTRAEVEGNKDSIEAFITAVRQHIEAYLDRALITQTLRMVMNGFPYSFRNGGISSIKLPRAPLQSIDNVTYFDIDDAAQVFDATKYVQLTDHAPGRVQPKYGETWPSSVRAGHVVQIDFVAGYGNAAADVPEAIRQALLLQVVETFKATNTRIKSETIDNVSRTYENKPPNISATPESTGLLSTTQVLLEPYRVFR